MIPRWYRKLMERGTDRHPNTAVLRPPAIIKVERGGPRGLLKDEIRQGLDASREKSEPTSIDWKI